MVVSAFHRDGERERRALAHLALHPDPSAVEFDDLPGTKPSEPVPFASFLTSASGLDTQAQVVLLELQCGDDACTRNETLAA